MDSKNIKEGDYLRLTDPISNGEIVRVESVDEHGCVSWIGGSQYADFEQCEITKVISDAKGNIIGTETTTLSEEIAYLEKIFANKLKLYPESAVLHYKHAAEVEAKDHAYYEQAWNKEHKQLLAAQDEIKLRGEFEKKQDRELTMWKQANNVLNKKIAELEAIRNELRAQIEAKGERIKQLQWDKDILEDDLLAVRDELAAAKREAADVKNNFNRQFNKLCELRHSNANNLRMVAELQAFLPFADKTPITVDWLLANDFFGNGAYCYTRYLNDDITIEITTIDEFVFVEMLGDGKHRNCDIRTVGQLRQFLTLCGQGEFAKTLK